MSNKLSSLTLTLWYIKVALVLVSSQITQWHRAKRWEFPYGKDWDLVLALYMSLVLSGFVSGT